MKFPPLLPSVVILAAFPWAAPAQFSVTGVADRAYNDHVNGATFTVAAQPGYSYTVLLDTNRVPTDVPVLVNQVDYHELNVWATNLATGVPANQLTRFIVRSGERGSSENGLPPWVPYPTIPSAAAEFDGAQLRLIVPAAFPQGYPIPLVAWVVNGSGKTVRANGELVIPDRATVRLKRGVGSGFLPPAPDNDPITFQAQLHGLRASKDVLPDNSTDWMDVSGTLSGATTWPANSRVTVAGTLSVPAGATLTIGAGTIVRVNPDVDINNAGQIVITGTTDQPVVFMPADPARPWGGFIQHANNASFTATGAIFTGAGANQGCWFTGHGCSSSLSGIGSHRSEQAWISLQGANCNLTLTDCAAMYLAGQFGHSASGGGNSYAITLTRTLVQRCTTGGEYTGALFRVNDCAFLEFDEDLTRDESPDFVDGDNDGLYLVNAPTGQAHGFTNTLIGWTKDDGVDSGGGGAGQIIYEGCWFESITHEGNSLSGTGKDVRHYGTVFLNCGQGIEDGYDAPTGRVDRCLATGNLVGVRFGDNYDWTYNGFQWATNSLLIYNYRDVWGRNWQSGATGWIYRTNQMDVRNNFLTTPNPHHPSNQVWQADADAWRLAGFLTIPPDAPVGVGLATWGNQFPLSQIFDGVPVRLSSFTTNVVTVDCAFEDGDGHTVGSSTLSFAPGETVKRFYPAGFEVATQSLVRAVLRGATHGELTGPTNVTFQGSVTVPQVACWVGVAQMDLARLGEGVPVRLSAPSALPVSVDYQFQRPGGRLADGTLVFAPGQTVQWIAAPVADPAGLELVRFHLSNPQSAALAAPSALLFVKTETAPPAANETLIARGARWRYRDAASAAPADWNGLNFDAGSWPEGPAQLGFGESDQATPIADNNQITSYFRHAFTVTDPTAFASLAMWMLRDDGGVVYLNGTEVYRSPNIPAGTVTYNTLTISGQNGENTIDTATLSAAAMQAGSNLLAVEIHQQDATSSDVSFDFELVGVAAPPQPPPQHVYAVSFAGELILAWGASGFVLEESDALSGPWTTVASSSPLTITPSARQKFYRLRKL